MKVYLLYSQKEWMNIESYYDTKSIIQDLGLKALFSAASRDVVQKNGKVAYIQHEDPFLAETMRKVMMRPLNTKEEILFRQGVLKDCFSREAFICDLYDMTTDMLEQWDKLGRKDKSKTGSQSPVAVLITQIHLLKLFVTSLSRIKSLFAEYQNRFSSRGLQSLYERLCEEYSEETEECLNKILQDISFYTDISESESINHPTTNLPKIVMECGIGDGLKLSDIRLQEVSSRIRKFHNPKGAISRIQEYMNSLIPDSFSIQKNPTLKEQASLLEFQVISYVVACCAPFMNAFSRFFDQLRFEAGFYRGALNIKHHMQRFHLDYCFPIPGGRDSLRFRNLKELVMCMEQRIDAVGNTCNIDHKMLLIVTGANQGGKSTFLRSIGVAQIMMQCGLAVAAESFESGIFPQFFTHFTRREDSAMNSGRLDEELRRMSRIVEQLGEQSLILLNESFASTTEKEGSVIAYDIVRALVEADVKILTVTHLLSFAQRMFDENRDNAASKVEFFCAERLEDGRRTFKMIPHEPELTSFGLDLYREIVGESPLI
ncbi:MAG: hypothetical protein NC081_02160 [Roseburia sp.]|nr:hypothetical protein [Roseburia sp.]